MSLALGDAEIESDVVYVSLAAGTYPNGARAVISAPRTSGPITASMVDGGLDPVPVPAAAGDTIELEILSVGSVTLAVERYKVPERRRPRVVRTVPPRGKTDVAVNSSIIVVFSEPVSTTTVSPSTVGVRRSGLSVAGTVRLLPGSGTVAVFTPNAALDRNTTYELSVSGAIADLEGDFLESAVSLSFTTGESSVGAPASIRISPDTVYLGGYPFQMTSTVTDAAGTELIAQVIWESSDPSGLSVSPTGLLTPLAPGNYSVTASIGAVQGRATVYVRGPPASVSVVPSFSTVPVSEVVVLSAAVWDVGGFALQVPVAWASSAPAVATIASNPEGAMVATVTGLTVGSATITAAAGQVSATTIVTVTPRRVVASVSVNPPSATLLVGAEVRLSATPRDGTGDAIPNRQIIWVSDNPAVATVEPNGRVVGAGVGTTRVTAAADGVSGAATITATTLNLASMSATHGHTCGVTADGSAYCWGRLTPLDDGTVVWSPWPIAVAAGLKFVSVAAGMTHSCALTAAGEAYCWGNGDAGQLGDGTGEHSYTTPVLVTGGLTFTSLTAGGPHTCGLTTTGQAYCWGSNSWGQLGDGEDRPMPATVRRFVPTPVAGGLTFAVLAAGKADHTCGLTTAGEAYCWGRGDFAKLGNGGTAHSNTPVRVQFAGDFVSIVAGWHHSCGLTADGTAYCWGGAGLGYGLTPVPISGLPGAKALAAGSSHTCGLIADGTLYCWGFNEEGRIGDGTTIDRPFPTRVSGGLSFSSVTAGGAHTCGLTTAGVAYCWGLNLEGQLGNGSETNSTVPLKIAAQP